MDSAAVQLVGAVFNGRWKLTRLLGEGGMGAVYEAQGTRGEGSRALKVLHPEFIHEEQVSSRFFAEAEAAQQLRHPNVAQVFESAKAEDGTPYLVMELLQGTPLMTYLERGQALSPQQTVHIGVGILEALKLAHARRIVHRDLKPDNLFLVPDGRGSYTVKVLDFGIAKVMDAAGGMGNKTRTGVLLGTPGYMSPEQIKNSKGVDPRSDLWSLGIIIYEMLTAKEPFPADNEFARLTAVLTDPIKPIAEVAPALAAWTPFFQRALAKDLAQRFQDAGEMSQALQAMSGGQAASPGHAAPSRAVPSQIVSQASPPPATMPGVQSAATPAPHAGSQPSPHQGSGYPPPMQQGGYPASAPLPAGLRAAGGTHVSAQRPEGVPTLQGPSPNVEVVAAPPRPGPGWWVVGVVGFVCLSLGFVAGFLAGG